MKLISKLYQIEEQWDRDAVAPERRKELRAQKSLPLAADLKALLDRWAVDWSILTHPHKNNPATSLRPIFSCT